MSLLALGVNHKTASLAVRDNLAFVPECMSAALASLASLSLVEEVIILSTCNRMEIYCRTETKNSADLLAWLADYQSLDLVDLKAYAYEHWDEDAVRHLMSVASGLDSLVLGEPQILGQLKSAYAQSHEGGYAGAELSRLFQQSFTVAKQVRTDTAIGENPVSVAYAAVNLGQHIFSDLTDSNVLLIGAGETIELVARYLVQAGVKNIKVANRTLSRAADLASEFDGEAILFKDVPKALERTDIVISSTASQLPILGKGAVETAIKARKHQPIFMLDIAVPRDIEPEVAELDDVYLYTVDDLKEVVQENQESRADAALEAITIIDASVHEFMRQLRVLSAVDTLVMLREKTERLRDQELDKALRQLANNKPAEEVLEQLAKGLTNKLLHQPTVQMRQASADGRNEVLSLVTELYQLSEDQQDKN